MNARTIARTLAGVSIAAALAFASLPAQAGGPRVSISFGINVPARLYVHEAEYYRPYYMGQVYFRPHRHAHVVYAFPVGGHYVPHVYCNHVLIRSGYVPTYDPRYDDYAAGYSDVVWDGRLAPAYVGIDLRFGPSHYAPRYAGERYGRGRARYGRYDDDDDDDRYYDRRRDRKHRHARDCDHD